MQWPQRLHDLAAAARKTATSGPDCGRSGRMAMPALLLLPARLDQGRTWKGSAGRAQADGLLVRWFAELGVF